VNYVIDSINTINLQQYVGYTIYDGENLIGEIVEAIESKMNNMFLVNYQGKEVLIPSQHDLIESTDSKGRIIHMKIPEGLLDL
jgi:16S rRNA processing protein RimM